MHITSLHTYNRHPRTQKTHHEHQPTPPWPDARAAHDVPGAGRTGEAACAEFEQPAALAATGGARGGADLLPQQTPQLSQLTEGGVHEGKSQSTAGVLLCFGISKIVRHQTNNQLSKDSGYYFHS